MPTPPKKKPYNIVYNDGSYYQFDLTNSDFFAIVERMQEGRVTIISENRALATKDIRTIVPFVAPPELPKQDAPTIPEELDDASKEWLRDNTSYYYEEGRSS